MRSTMAGLGLAAASGVLLAAAAEPFALGPVAWVALVPLLVACRRAGTVRRAAAYGLVAGSVFFGTHLYWIFLFGWMAWTALTLALAAYVAVAAAGVRISAPLPLAPVLAAGWWVALELARGTWPWGGFAWTTLGTTQASVPGVRWLAGSIGAYGLSFLCAFVAAVVADRLVRGRVSWASLAVVGAPVLLFAGVDAVWYGRPEPGRSAEIAVIQGSVPRPRVADQDRRVFDNHARLSRQLIASGERPDIVVWPESAAGYLDDRVVGPVVSVLAQTLDRPLLVGRTRADYMAGTFDNLVEQVAPSGEVVSAYAKRRAVPFGERVPLGFLRGFVSTLDQVPLDMAPGREAIVLDAAGIRVGAPVCFESVFPGDVRSFVRAGAEVIVVSTNDASFERTYASRQHLAHARLRALEHRQWVVQAAISGESAVVAPDASVSHRTSLFEPAILRATVQARGAGTLYTRAGDLFSYVWVAGTLLATLASVASPRSRRRDEGSMSATARHVTNV